MHTPIILTENFWKGFEDSYQPSFSKLIQINLTLGYLSGNLIPTVANELLNNTDDYRICELATLVDSSLREHGETLKICLEEINGSALTEMAALLTLTKRAIVLNLGGEITPYFCSKLISELWFWYVQDKRQENFYVSSFVPEDILTLKWEIDIFHGEFYNAKNIYAEDEDFELDSALKVRLSAALFKLNSNLDC